MYMVCLYTCTFSLPMLSYHGVIEPYIACNIELKGIDTSYCKMLACSIPRQRTISFPFTEYFHKAWMSQTSDNLSTLLPSKPSGASGGEVFRVTSIRRLALEIMSIISSFEYLKWVPENKDFCNLCQLQEHHICCIPFPPFVSST